QQRSCLMPTGSLGPQMHRATHLIEGLPRCVASLLGTFGNDTAHELWILLEFLRPLAQVGHFLDHLVDDRLLAIETADACRATALVHPGASCIVRVDLV